MTRKLQIVRVDNDLVQKADLKIGNNVIGRSATDCNDGQVLKHAMTINVSPDDEMTITAVAPCYVKSIGCTRWRALALGTRVPIKPGDACSLLPEKCWFKIISVPEMMNEAEEPRSKRKADEELNNEPDNKKACLSFSMETIASPSETLNDILNNDNAAFEHQESPVNGDTELNDTDAPQEIYSASSPAGDDLSVMRSEMSLGSQNESTEVASAVCENDGKRKAESADSTENIATAEPQKKIKRDCTDQFVDQDGASSSQVEAKPQQLNTAVKPHQNQASAPSAESVPREKCMYGDRCYRKNRNHKKNYSHPNDPDYDDENDDREECPYGVRCYRKNLQHKAQFKHTIVPRRRRRRTASPMHHPAVVDTSFESDASSMEESVDESDYEPSSAYSESSEKSDWEDSGSEWEDGTTG